jgi:prepilin-type N-terminal cleavage/methylation domain-containing protein
MNNFKKGFTLVELLVVIALIGLSLVATTYLSKDSRIYQVNAERLANNIYDTMRQARNNMIIGRWVFTGGTLVVALQRDIVVTPTSLVTNYKYAGNNSGTESSLVVPFFDDDSRYQITDISVSSGWLVDGAVPLWDHTWATDATVSITHDSTMQILANNWWAQLLPSPSAIRTLKITAGYAGMEQSVIIDRANGTIEIKKSGED